MSKPRFRLPTPPAPAPSLEAFMLFPLAAVAPQSPEQAAAQRALYEWAFAEAQAVVRPSILERDLLSVWN